MYLLDIEITDLRAIRDLKVDFRRVADAAGDERARRWTVFLGENGCGKSTILKAIALLLAGSDALAELLEQPDQWIRNGADEARIAATICTAAGEERRVAVSLHRGDRRDSVIKRNAEGLAELDAALRHADRNYFIAGYGAFRRPPDPRSTSGMSSRSFGRAAHLQTLFSASPDLVGLEQWAVQLDYAEGDAGRRIVAQALDRLLPGMTFKDIDKRSGEVIMRTVDGDVALRQLSEGYQAMAAWAGDLLYRMSETFRDRRNPLEARGVLLIDEMDLHLHPVWKRRLVDFLDEAFPRLQVIATTHSPLSVQQCNEHELYVVRRESGIPVLLPFVGDPSKMRLSELFLSPLVGLDTLDSPKVADLRAEARTIELKPGAPSAADRNRLRTINRQLEGTRPIVSAEAPGMESLLNLSERKRSGDVLARIAESETLFGRRTPSGRESFSRRAGEAGKKPAAGKPAIKKTPARTATKKPASAAGTAAKKAVVKRPVDKVKTKVSAKKASAKKVSARRTARR